MTFNQIGGVWRSLRRNPMKYGWNLQNRVESWIDESPATNEGIEVGDEAVWQFTLRREVAGRALEEG